jgi:hypothetical protein
MICVQFTKINSYRKSFKLQRYNNGHNEEHLIKICTGEHKVTLLNIRIHGRMTTLSECERTGKEVVMIYIRHYSKIYLNALGKIAETSVT